MKTQLVLNRLLLTIIISFGYFMLVLSQPVPLWKFAKTGLNAEPEVILSDSLGNVFVGGSFHNDSLSYQGHLVLSTPYEANNKVFILKTDPMGKMIYLNPIFGLQDGSNVYIIKMDINDKGEIALLYYIYGATSFRIRNEVVNINPDNHYYAAKFSKTGYLLWNQEIIASGDDSGNHPMDICLDGKGTAYLTGYFSGDQISISDHNVNGYVGNDAMFLSAIDHSGNVLWLKNCQATDTSGNMHVMNIECTQGNLLYIGGIFGAARTYSIGSSTLGPTSGAGDAFVACYDKNGLGLWARAIGGTTEQQFKTLTVNQNEDVFVCGLFRDSVVIGGTQYIASNSACNMFLAKYNNKGGDARGITIMVEHPYMSTGDETYAMAADMQNNLVLAAEFYGNSVLLTPYDLFNSSPGSAEMMFVSFDAGTLFPNRSLRGAGSGENLLEGVHIDKNGNIYLAGTQFIGNLVISSRTVTGDTVYGSPYLFKLNPDMNVEYSYTDINSADASVNMINISCDAFGNVYTMGTFQGVNSNLDGIDLTTTGDNGFFIGRYSEVREITGHVVNDNSIIVNEGYVKLMGYTYRQNAPLSDSVPIGSDGSFVFADVPLGNYILKAVPAGSAADSYLPTYYPSAEYWELTDKIIINPTIVLSDFLIILVNKGVFEGTASLQGSVFEADSSDIMKSAMKIQGRPSQSATVVLAGDRSLKSTYEVVAITYTDAGGNFAFTNVDDGTYYLWVDLPGLPTVDQYIVDIVGGQFISNLNYMVDEEKVSRVGLPLYSRKTIDSDQKKKEIRCYPNPATGYISVEIMTGDSPDGILEIYDSKGALISTYILNEQNNIIDLTSFSQGTYVFTVKTDETTVHEKINIIK